MTKEYKIVQLYDVSLEGEKVTLNHHGIDGWKLVSVVHFMEQSEPKANMTYLPVEVTKLYFEREKAEHNSV